MSTYLQICKDLAEEVGVTNGGPTDVTTQTGDLQLIVQWVKRAWIEIQNRHMDWRWMHREFTFDTVSGTDKYAYGAVTDVDATGFITRFSRWMIGDDDEPPKSYLTSGGVGSETWLSYSPFVHFTSVYDRGTQTSGAPAQITVDRANNLRVGPNPSGIYTITGQFVRSAQVLAADGDIPEMPTQFHDLIMYRAMEKYARYESAEEILARSEVEGGRLMYSLESNQLPAIFLAGPLA